MAKHTTVTLVDDLDGGDADEQVQFAVDGKSYEIDLSTKNAEKLRDQLAPYVSAARRAGGRSAASGATSNSSNSSSASDRAMNRAVREWAVDQGMKISERGRIPSSVLEAYRNAH